MFGGRYKVFFCVFEKKRRVSIVVVPQNVFLGPPFFFFFFVSKFCVKWKTLFVKWDNQWDFEQLTQKERRQKNDFIITKTSRRRLRRRRPNRQILKSCRLASKVVVMGLSTIIKKVVVNLQKKCFVSFSVSTWRLPRRRRSSLSPSRQSVLCVF